MSEFYSFFMLSFTFTSFIVNSLQYSYLLFKVTLDELSKFSSTRQLFSFKQNYYAPNACFYQHIIDFFY